MFPYFMAIVGSSAADMPIPTTSTARSADIIENNISFLFIIFRTETVRSNKKLFPSGGFLPPLGCFCKL